MEILKLSEIKAHNLSMRYNRTPIIKDTNSIRHSIEEQYLQQFASNMVEVRQGIRFDKDGKQRKRPAKDIYLHQALEAFFGMDIKAFFKTLEMDSDSFSLGDVYNEFGGPSVLGKPELEKLLIDRANYSFGTEGSFAAVGKGGQASTLDVPSDYHFIIPELIIAAIRIGYEGTAQHMKWIAMTQSMTQRRLKMPQIQRGDATPTRIREGSSIPKGSLNFTQKEVDVFKVGTAFNITDELIYESSIDMIMEFLSQVGTEMGINSDVEALRVLISGEQADGTEDAPVVGVTTATSRTWPDLKNVFWQMGRLGNKADRIITNQTEGLLITSIDKLEGFQGETKLAEAKTIVGVPDRFEIDIHAVPANKAIFLSSTRCMAKLNYRGMKIEQRRNPDNQTNELYVTDHVGFAIIRRDGRVIQDRSVTFASAPFPSYMDIDTRIAESFNNF